MVRYAMLLLLIIGAAASLHAQADSVATADVSVTDARLGSNVENRMIVQEATTFPVGSKVYVWLKVVGAPAGGITVIWKTGSFSHATTLPVGGSPWRTWATKTVHEAGPWSVTVTDEAGKVLKELSFTVE